MDEHPFERIWLGQCFPHFKECYSRASKGNLDNILSLVVIGI